MYRFYQINNYILIKYFCCHYTFCHNRWTRFAEHIINILELDNDKTKQVKILKLIPEIRKYNSFSTIIWASK